jgi:predicted N-acyltransferase
MVRPELTAEEYHRLAGKIVNAIESHCRAEGWYLIFRGIVEPDDALRRVFADRPYVEGAESPGTVMDIRWNSWHDYLKDLKNTHPSTEKGIRVQSNRGRRGGVIIEELTAPSTVEADLYRILAEHHFRKNRTPFYMGEEFMTVLKKNLGDRAVILVARKDGRIVGISIHLRNSSAMQLKFVGIATDMVKSREAVYFNITYHELIRRAYEEGFERLYLGILTYEPKYRRGARLIPVSSWVWQPGRLRAFMLKLILSYQARWQDRRLAPFVRQNPAGKETALAPYRWPLQPKVRD